MGNMKRKKFEIDTCLSGMICNTSYALAEEATADEMAMTEYTVVLFLCMIL